MPICINAEWELMIKVVTKQLSIDKSQFDLKKINQKTKKSLIDKNSISPDFLENLGE